MGTRPTASDPDAELLTELADRVDTGLRSALAGAREVALVNFPNHNNPGDSAIWLGAAASLRRLGVRIRYRCAWCTYDPDGLRRALPEGPVLLNGGGNFGDLYAGQQGLRERLLAELTDRRLIQLPQSIHFRDNANLQRMRRLVDSHGDVTLLMRERRSEALAREVFDADVQLVPDLAFALRELPRSVDTPDVDALWLHRVANDPEYVDHGRPPADLSVHDVEWLLGVPGEPAWSRRARLARAANDRLLPRCRDDRRWARHAWRPLAATFAPLGTGYLERGLNIMARGRVLVTDKLHGHILALLSGRPHVVMDNSYGKVSATYETWTRPSTLVHWARDWDEAQVLVGDILGRSNA